MPDESVPESESAPESEPPTAPEPLPAVHDDVVDCFRCPRLVDWRETVAREKRRQFADWDYWGRPVPGFGDPDARVLVVGLAPAAHGANRTGRVFTGDRSGDWLFRSMHRAGLANQAESVSRDDGLRLTDTYVTAAVKCAPPGNRPTNEERDHCFEYLVREARALEPVRVFVVLGQYAYTVTWRLLGELGIERPRPRPPFAHGAEVAVGGDRTVVCSYHPSQQNTFTGKLTEDMLDGVFVRARELARSGEAP